ncbi:SDR family oxidoreductase [Aciduricibacillus chroicocephali]|uniref:SDR family oxidoreductase n=1 Tax=Aciduricibacillus chroicocephali TaxID=3054939 RepID=A0ABY9KVC8_9BACI|nr:SDR family oxidoreductase [Bacillaceae bacterium 44XB]
MSTKTAIITGASSGIGQAAAKKLAAKGMNIMLAARREERLIELKKEIESAGGKAEYLITDVTKVADMEKLAEKTIELFGQIDILINNAGLMPLSYLRKKKVDEWDRMIDVNIKGVLYGIGAVLPHMEARESGHIINVASVAGHTVRPSTAVYSGTKFAVRAITEGLRQELNPEHDIRVTIISPGVVATELTDFITDDDAMDLFKKRNIDIPLESEDIANAIAYAVEQPNSVDVNEIVIRPTRQKP